VQQREPADDARLADPGLACDQHETTLAAGGLCEEA
jgi:hypothetical protein